MSNPTVRQLEACSRISVTERDFLEFLKARLKEYDRNSRRLPDDVPMRWAQGRAQEVEDLIDMIEKAPEHLRRAQNSTSR